MLDAEELVAQLSDVPRAREALRVLVDDGLVTSSDSLSASRGCRALRRPAARLASSETSAGLEAGADLSLMIGRLEQPRVAAGDDGHP